jgi:hypothetical protein
MQRSQHCFAVFETCIPKPPIELNIGKASSCAQSKEILRKCEEMAIITVLADRWRRGLWLIPMTSKNEALSNIIFSMRKASNKKNYSCIVKKSCTKKKLTGKVGSEKNQICSLGHAMLV